MNDEPDPSPGALFVVATPIGNLSDLSPRARSTLAEVDTILAEDTRRTGILLAHCGISTPLRSFHDHNEDREIPRILSRIAAGEKFALVSDAGTPLISDPGYTLLRQARKSDLRVYCVPGPCALVAALSVSGLPVDRFVFAGFLPPRPSLRRRELRLFARETKTMVFYEAPHRLASALSDMGEILGEDREAAIARELTKRFESVHCATLGSLLSRVRSESIVARGEIVLVVRGALESSEQAGDDGAVTSLLSAMLAEGISVRQAAAVAARLDKGPRNALYRQALSLAKKEE
ncbi:16S rRNA (cytidine(1402)-2'-O)-methyltransferase [Thioalkalivibrio sp. HK1]|uniref:16S rRNA (cytidine(1402)-2'-O)-methyltransferase n=1 Tax=Thioalkalivibrio sp. HK1 TaxID=1469245 RepID=UPI000470B207|nr:16S rRNA (cytidine(1402)-2'-O)-methyltransferase [Thioalkalivibrio sp. HK1]